MTKIVVNGRAMKELYRIEVLIFSIKKDFGFKL